MAKFTFSIESEEKHEMAALLSGLFDHVAPAEAVTAPAPVLKRSKLKLVDEAVAEVVVDEVVEPAKVVADDVTLDMLKAKGSAIMPKVRAAGLGALIAQHGGGATAFGNIDPAYYLAVYAAMLAVE